MRKFVFFPVSGKRRMAVAAVGLAAVIAAAGAGWYFFSGAKPVATQTASIGNAEDANICSAAMTRAKAYGVLPPASELLDGPSEKPASAQNAVCHAKSGEKQFAIKIDFECSGQNTQNCFRILTVTDNDGAALFERSL